MAEPQYHPGLPEPQLAHEMWSREICDRLDKMIGLQEQAVDLLRGQNKLLSGTQTVSVSGPVELTEPKTPKAAPAAARTPAPAARTATTTKK
jgi:hypothetical protein